MRHEPSKYHLPLISTYLRYATLLPSIYAYISSDTHSVFVHYRGIISCQNGLSYVWSMGAGSYWRDSGNSCTARTPHEQPLRLLFAIEYRFTGRYRGSGNRPARPVSSAAQAGNCFESDSEKAVTKFTKKLLLDDRV